MTRLFIAAASGLSGLVIIASLATVVYIFNDINSFYDDVMEDMGEFKVDLDFFLLHS